MKSKRAPSRSYGMTLVELLVVVASMTLLASITLPTVKKLMKDRRTNQASIQLRGVIESAKARAAGRNRDVAVILERMDDSNDGTDLGTRYIHRNTSVRVSLAEVLPPYRGDLDGAMAQLMVSPTHGNNTLPNQIPGLVNVAAIDTIENPSLALFAVSGNTISFGDRTERFEILAVNTSISSGVMHIAFANRPIAVPAGFVSGTLPLRSSVFLPENSFQSFRIYSKPRRLFNKPIDLPKGTCIDLSLSGLGISGTQFASDIIDPLTETNMSVVNRYFKPIYIVFTPRGEVSEIYGNGVGFTNGSSTRVPTFGRIIPTAPIYLFVGRSEQVTKWRAGLPSEYLANLQDATGYWIRIVPETGQVSMAPNIDPVADGASDYVGYSRTYSTYGADASAK